MSYECLKGDGRRRGLLSDWEKWLRQADKLYSRFLTRTEESPFCYHEIASVGFLASAAAIAGYLPFAEYDIVKRSKYDRAANVNGRADLWFDADPRCYSFEFKRAWLAASIENLTDVMQEACEDIDCIHCDEYNYAAGGLIARVRDVSRMSVYRNFAETDKVDLAYRIGPNGENGAFLFFKLVA